MRRALVTLTAVAMLTAACAQNEAELLDDPAVTGAEGEDLISVEPFCNAMIDTATTASQGPDVDFETATEEEIGAAMGDFATRLEPLLAELESSAPSELREPVDTMAALLREGLESGEPAFDDPAYIEADRTLDEFVVSNCDVHQVSIEAIEYEFQGVPETIPSGTVAFDFTNKGGEVHEMVVFRVNEGVTESITELLELPEEEAIEKVEFMGVAFAVPGSGDITFADLVPGNYAMLCFVPVGTTSMDALGGPGGEEAEGEGGPPHFTQGMIAEFTVES